jgi:carboxyl-terminal processing protease
MGKQNWNKMKVTLTLASTMLAALPALASAQESDAAVQEVEGILSQVHVSGVTDSALKGKSIPDMVKSLNDPYTIYFTDKEIQQFQGSLENSYVGMGARVGFDKDGVYLGEIFAGSPAEKAGLHRDDYVVAVNGVSVKGEAVNTVVSKIVGDAGTTVQITVQRGDKQITVPIVRAALNIPEVYSKRFDNQVGYIQITDFSSDADEDFDRQLKDLQAKGLSSLIIDLRNDPGGLLDTALNISKHFVKEGTLIHTRDRNQTDTPISITGGTTIGVPVYILLNDMSASASEVLSGALQDYGVAKVIGIQSYGKGSVQQIYNLENGGALKVTVDEYLTPNLHKVNKVGITPDIKADGSAAQMITALHQAGIADVSVQIFKHEITMNGVEVSDAFHLIRDKGHLYAPTRALAALVNADITWNDSLKTVEVSSSGGKHAFTANSDDLQIVDGTSYVNVDAFKADFTGLQVTDNGEQVTIQAAKGN